MERLTDECWRNLDPWECCGQDRYCKRDCHEKGGCANGCVVPQMYIKLAEYEEAEERGLLFRLPCKYVYHIVDKNTQYAMTMKKPIEELTIIEISGIDKWGKYYSTREAAEQALVRMGESEADINV